jgi:hypothetical protein
VPSPAEFEPVADDEILYRRVPVSKGWVDEHGVRPDAFEPRTDDHSGLSVYRARFVSLEDAAKGLSKRGYYVLAMRAGDLRAAGINVVPMPQDDLPGHAELPSLAYQEQESELSIEQRELLADRLIMAIHGPFVPGKGGPS